MVVGVVYWLFYPGFLAMSFHGVSFLYLLTVGAEMIYLRISSHSYLKMHSLTEVFHFQSQSNYLDLILHI